MSDAQIKSEDLSSAAHFAWNLILTTHPKTTNAHRVGEFKAAFARVFGADMDTCPRDKWKPLFDQGMKELADAGLIAVEKDGMGGWAVTDIYPERLLAGSGFLLEM